jgi:hypothetical protein
MSTSGKKRTRAVCLKAYKLSVAGFTNREIATLILCKPEQVPGKVKAGSRMVVMQEEVAK